jgi:anti-anti-sigma factor
MNTLSFSLPPEITIKTVSEVKEQLNELLNQAGAVTLDAENISRIDTVGLQLLLAFSRQLVAQERSSQICRASPTLVKVAATLGLSTVLAIDAINESA